MMANATEACVVGSAWHGGQARLSRVWLCGHVGTRRRHTWYSTPSRATYVKGVPGAQSASDSSSVACDTWQHSPPRDVVRPTPNTQHSGAVASGW
jgi:hypothetical protein